MTDASIELWTSGARDVFGFRFRDAWHVRGWDEGQFPPTYFCEWAPAHAAAPVEPSAPQLELFA